MGYFLGQDNILPMRIGAPKTPFSVVPKSTDLVCYGCLLKNSSNQYIAVIRGTDGAEEWFDDFDFFKKTPPLPIEGQVDSGFYDIFDSLIYQPMSNGQSCLLAQGIATAIQHAEVTVLGHSLGAALGAYLSGELAALCGAKKVSACLFACPKPGDQSFATYFSGLGIAYDVFNNEADIVSRLPPLGYSALPNVTLLNTGGISGTVHIAENTVCCHHLISYIALLDVQTFKQTIALTGTTSDDLQCAQCVTLNASATIYVSTHD